MKIIELLAAWVLAALLLIPLAAYLPAASADPSPNAASAPSPPICDNARESVHQRDANFLYEKFQDGQIDGEITETGATFFVPKADGTLSRCCLRARARPVARAPAGQPTASRTTRATTC